MSHRSLPAILLADLLDEEKCVVGKLAGLCDSFRTSLASGLSGEGGMVANSIDTLLMRFRTLEDEVGRMLEEHGWSRAELQEAVRATADQRLIDVYAELLDAVRGLSRANLINACLLERWSRMNRGLLTAIQAAVSPTYVPDGGSLKVPAGSRLVTEA